MSQYILFNTKDAKYKAVIAKLKSSVKYGNLCCGVLLSDNGEKAIVKINKWEDADIVKAVNPSSVASLKSLVTSDTSKGLVSSISKSNVGLMTLYYSSEFGKQHPPIEDVINGK